MCPMRFNKFPLDEHSCKFMVGSTNYDDTRMTFANDKLEYDPSAGNTILDYQVSFFIPFNLFLVSMYTEHVESKCLTAVMLTKKKQNRWFLNS